MESLGTAVLVFLVSAAFVIAAGSARNPFTDPRSPAPLRFLSSRTEREERTLRRTATSSPRCSQGDARVPRNTSSLRRLGAGPRGLILVREGGSLGHKGRPQKAATWGVVVVKFGALCAHPFARVALFVLLAGLWPARSEELAPPPPEPQLTPADVTAFLDGLVPYQIEANDIAGATIAIVKDGKVFFAKGYGVADTKTKAPVTTETMFRIGSVTKLFTWTAVMQLVEQGKLDLDSDINLYLDFKIPQRFAKPVTLRNLMTHRGGFQEAIKGLGAQNSGVVDLQAYVRENRPDQIFQPGTTPARRPRSCTSTAWAARSV